MQQILFRPPSLRDVHHIYQIAKEFYSGYEVSEEILSSWVKDLPEQFIAVEINSEIAGCVFWEYLEEIDAIPYFHRVEEYHRPQGKYAYVGEIILTEKYKNKGLMWLLYGAMEVNLKEDCEGIIWVTGAPELIREMSHEESEHTILKIGGFKFVRNIKSWEYGPDRFTDSHNIYFKKIER